MLEFHLGQELELNEILELQEHWNKKLEGDLDHPYPLAPAGLITRCVLTNDKYNRYNTAFGEFCSYNMRKELQKFVEERHFGKLKNPTIEIWGPGLARDLSWVVDAVEMGFILRIRDISCVACRCVSDKYHDYIKKGKIKLVIGEIEETWDKEIESSETVLFYASQFVQVLKDELKMKQIMRRLGTLLNNKPVDRPEKRIYLVHPFEMDNIGPRRWEGTDLPNVGWGETTPYSKEQLVDAAVSGCKDRGVVIDMLDQHDFYNLQRYSFLRLMAKK